MHHFHLQSFQYPIDYPHYYSTMADVHPIEGPSGLVSRGRIILLTITISKLRTVLSCLTTRPPISLCFVRGTIVPRPVLLTSSSRPQHQTFTLVLVLWFFMHPSSTIIHRHLSIHLAIHRSNALNAITHSHDDSLHPSLFTFLQVYFIFSPYHTLFPPPISCRPT